MQSSQPLAILSKGLKGRALLLSTHENELLALLIAVQKWWPYLLGQSFIIKTEQQALKYMLEQRVGTSTQHKWVSKLLGSDFNINYKKGKENKVADSLSRREDSVEEKQGLLAMLSFTNPDWVEELKASCQDSKETHKLMETLQGNSSLPKRF